MTAQNESPKTTAPRVTLESITAKIASVEYHHPEICPHMTVAFLQMTNGFIMLGKSAPVSAENFDAELGQKLAYDDALRRIWAFEGYMLREELASPFKVWTGQMTPWFEQAGVEMREGETVPMSLESSDGTSIDFDGVNMTFYLTTETGREHELALGDLVVKTGAGYKVA